MKNLLSIMRNLLPYRWWLLVAASLYLCAAWFSNAPLSVTFAFVAALVVFLACQNDIKIQWRRWVLAAVLAVVLLGWVLLFYHAGSSGGWMLSFLLLALASLRRKQFFAVGLFFVAALSVLYQIGFVFSFPALIIVAARFFRPKTGFALSLSVFKVYLRPDVLISRLVAGVVAALAGGILIDWWFYEKPFWHWFNIK